MPKNNILFCTNKCCTLFITNDEIKEPMNYLLDRKYRIKSGIFTIDKNNRILLSQSYNSHWGIPKGTREEYETNEEASMRELKEETGITFTKNFLENSKIQACMIHRRLYVVFLKKLNVIGPMTEKHPEKLLNESTGCGWINVYCLYKMYKNKTIKINILTRLLLNKYTNLKWC